MNAVVDIGRPRKEGDPANLEDAIEMIASLRAVVDEQADQIEELTFVDTDKRHRRERFVALILPKMIDMFGCDMNVERVDEREHSRSLICSNTVRLADRLIAEMDATE